MFFAASSLAFWSWEAVTVTVWAVSQVTSVKGREAGLTVNLAPLGTVGVTVTFSVGWVSRTTVYCLLPPSGMLRVVGSTVTPALSSSVRVMVRLRRPVDFSSTRSGRFPKERVSFSPLSAMSSWVMVKLNDLRVSLGPNVMLPGMGRVVVVAAALGVGHPDGELDGPARG